MAELKQSRARETADSKSFVLSPHNRNLRAEAKSKLVPTQLEESDVNQNFSKYIRTNLLRNQHP